MNTARLLYLLRKILKLRGKQHLVAVRDNNGLLHYVKNIRYRSIHGIKLIVIEHYDGTITRD
jgi:hypothetical protein